MFLLLPQDFGVAKLKCQVHNNVELVWPDGFRVPANSAILALNSPVLEDLITKQNSSIIHIGRLSEGVEGGEPARQFVEALYAGRVHLTRDNFIEIATLATILQVSWVDYQCRRWFEARLSRATNYPGLLASVKAAVALHPTTDTYSSLALPALQALPSESLADFLRSFLAETDLSTGHLEFVLQLTQHHGGAISALLHVLKDKVESTGEFDGSASFLFQNLNVASCLKYDGRVYNELLDLLFDAGLQQNYCYRKSSNRVYQMLDVIMRPCRN